MRRILLLITALAAATPAMAHEPRAPLPEEELADRLNDPALAAGIETSISAALGAILDLRIGAFERAIDPGSGAQPDDTLRDRALDDDPYFEERIADDVQRTTRTMGSVATEMAVLMPELRAMAADMGRRIDDIGARYRPGDDARDD